MSQMSHSLSKEKYHYMSWKSIKKSSIASHIWLVCRALFFQSSTCTKTNRFYISIPYNQDGDQTVAVVMP